MFDVDKIMANMVNTMLERFNMTPEKATALAQRAKDFFDGLDAAKAAFGEAFRLFNTRTARTEKMLEALCKLHGIEFDADGFPVDKPTQLLIAEKPNGRQRKTPVAGGTASEPEGSAGGGG